MECMEETIDFINQLPLEPPYIPVVCLPFKTRSAKKITLVLDLDETLGAFN